MLKPPFRLAAPAAAYSPLPGDACCQPGEPQPTREAGRARLADLDLHLHCSVIGTCLGTAELRRLMANFCETAGASDLEVHHEAVRRAAADPAASRALHKALDRRHEAAVQRFAAARDDAALLALWEDALQRGDVPAAYWALLTHRRATNDLRQRAFGDVHMLSHLVGASNRADLRRLAALEQDNADLRQRIERQQQQLAERDAQREAAQAAELQQSAEIGRLRAELARAREDVLGRATPASSAALAAQVALQTERRERAEHQAQALHSEVQRLQSELAHERRQAADWARELAAAERQLRARLETNDEAGAPRLAGRRILYVGGRPSSTPAIRDLVQREGGDFQRHDGGIEDRKGLLAAAVAWADTVVFPVDCVDHDSALALKRLCQRHERPFKALRTASVTSFAAGVLEA